MTPNEDGARCSRHNSNAVCTPCRKRCASSMGSTEGSSPDGITYVSGAAVVFKKLGHTFRSSRFVATVASRGALPQAVGAHA